MKIFKRVSISLFLLGAVAVVATFLFMQRAVFGKNPAGERLARVEKSTHYKEGSFWNVHETPMLAPGVSYGNMTLNFFFAKPENTEPLDLIPSVKTNLKSIARNTPVIVWFGHSSYLISMYGKNFLMDPVFSGHASPVSFSVKSYAGTDVYAVEDFPALDGVIISHDHYDHLDYETILKLNSITRAFYVPLGIGEHLEHWGIEADKIKEFDWWEELMLPDSMKIIATPARHFSGRSFTRGKTLWASFVLQSPAHRLYMGGDSGYDDHFSEIGTKYGPFDLAFLECGQYNVQWPYIHMMPEETIQAGIDLRANAVMPVHSSKFTLALHPWSEPLERASRAADSLNVKITTPKIGEPIVIGESYPN